MAELLAPGEQAGPNWEVQGVDLVARMAAHPEGINRTATISDMAGDRSVDHYGEGTLPNPPGLEPVLDLPGQPMSGDVHWQTISELGDGVWMRASAKLVRRGNARCGRGWETLTILKPGDAPLSEEMRFAVMFVRLMAERMRQMEVCSIAFEQPDGTLIERSFLPDGRPLPKLDEQSKPVRIRPLADATAILNP
ncbi:hypothetical protein [Sphingomonas sp. J315]|nr:hypothetical protein [Sphingomonas sp. J315]UUX99536.1 hypothetical protein LRS08_19285 [Sphingomonas sp. J315]